MLNHENEGLVYEVTLNSFVEVCLGNFRRCYLKKDFFQLAHTLSSTYHCSLVAFLSKINVKRLCYSANGVVTSWNDEFGSIDLIVINDILENRFVEDLFSLLTEKEGYSKQKGDDEIMSFVAKVLSQSNGKFIKERGSQPNINIDTDLVCRILMSYVKTSETCELPVFQCINNLTAIDDICLIVLLILNDEPMLRSERAIRDKLKKKLKFDLKAGNILLSLNVFENRYKKQKAFDKRIDLKKIKPLHARDPLKTTCPSRSHKELFIPCRKEITHLSQAIDDFKRNQVSSYIILGVGSKQSF